jgi:hypothetical protein
MLLGPMLPRQHALMGQQLVVPRHLGAGMTVGHFGTAMTGIFQSMPFLELLCSMGANLRNTASHEMHWVRGLLLTE